MTLGRRLYWIAALVAVLALAGAGVTLASGITSARGGDGASPGARHDRPALSLPVHPRERSARCTPRGRVARDPHGQRGHRVLVGPDPRIAARIRTHEHEGRRGLAARRHESVGARPRKAHRGPGRGKVRHDGGRPARCGPDRRGCPSLQRRSLLRSARGPRGGMARGARRAETVPAGADPDLRGFPPLPEREPSWGDRTPLPRDREDGAVSRGVPGNRREPPPCGHPSAPGGNPARDRGPLRRTTRGIPAHPIRASARNQRTQRVRRRSRAPAIPTISAMPSSVAHHVVSGECPMSW